MTARAEKKQRASGGARRAVKLAAAAALPRDPNDDGRWAKAFERAGSPDLENPETDLAYTRKLQLIVLKQMSTTPFPTRAQQDCWRRIREMSAVVGMTSSRAALESTVKKLRKQLEESKQVGTVTEVPGSSIAKPPTARGASRGPRPLAPDPVPDEPKH